MIRLFTPHCLTADTLISPDEKQIHYLKHVMRLQEGACVALFNGKDGTWSARYHTVGKKGAQLIVTEQIADQQSRERCILCPALIKKENMDLVLQKATELGVTEIRPVITTRTVVRQLNTARGEAIITEACEQCERNDIPLLYPPQTLPALLSALTPDITVIHLAERESSSAKLSPDMIPAFIVGPEGGFTPEENALIQAHPTTRVIHLGTTVLRAETASLAVLSAWQFRLF